MKTREKIIEALKKHCEYIHTHKGGGASMRVIRCSKIKAIADELEQQPAKELFEKVYIRSEDDLPEEGKEFITQSNYKGNCDGLCWKKIKKYSDGSHTWRDIDWYLRPVE